MYYFNQPPIQGFKKEKRYVKSGFPVSLEDSYSGRLLNSEIAAVVIKQTGRYVGRIMEHLPVKMMKPV